MSFSAFFQEYYEVIFKARNFLNLREIRAKRETKVAMIVSRHERFLKTKLEKPSIFDISGPYKIIVFD